MIESNPTLTKYVDRLWRVCSDLQRGDVLTHAMVHKIVQVAPHTKHWQSCMNRLRRRMERERGIALWPEPTVGYRLLTAQEQLELLPRKRAERATRQYRRARRSVAALDSADLSPHQQRLKSAQLDTLRQATQDARALLKVQTLLSRRTETRPRPVHGEPELMEATA